MNKDKFWYKNGSWDCHLPEAAKCGPLGNFQICKRVQLQSETERDRGMLFYCSIFCVECWIPFQGSEGWTWLGAGSTGAVNETGLDLSLSYAYALITSTLIGSHFTPLGNWKCINGPANAATSPASTRWRESPYWVSSDGLISFRRYKQGRTQVGLNSKFFTRQEHGSLFPARFTYFSPSFLCAIVKKKMFLLNDNWYRLRVCRKNIYGSSWWISKNKSDIKFLHKILT